MDRPSNADGRSELVPTLSTRQISVIAVMTAVCVSTNYLLIGVINVKFMDLIVFVCGYAFGSLVGGSVGVLTWLVYGTINPYGFSLPIQVTTCLGEGLYGIVGDLFSRVEADAEEERCHLGFVQPKFAIVGFLLTFVYDIFTNIVSGIVIGIPLVVALASGIPFAFAHEFSNTVLFLVGVMPLVSAIRRSQLGGNSK